MGFGFEKELKMQNFIRKISFMISILILIFSFFRQRFSRRKSTGKELGIRGRSLLLGRGHRGKVSV